MAAVQIEYQPAYLGRSFSYLREPAIFEETENGLCSLVQFPEVDRARNRIKAAWLEHIRQKLEPILCFCAGYSVDLVVFPEYSIPVHLLPQCQSSADNRATIIVAGSHTVAADDESRRVYEQIGLANLNLSPSDPDSDIRKSICPILVPKASPVIVEKRSRSVWEPDMTSGHPASTLNVKIRGTDLRLGILLCIDALRMDNFSALFGGANTPELLIMPSLSRTTSPFENVAQLCNMNEIPSIYANIASAGGTKILARSGTAMHNWPMEKDGTCSVPEGAEAVVIADISFDEQVDVRRTVKPHLGARIVSYAPLLYVKLSDLCSTFVGVRSRLCGPRRPLNDEALDEFSMLSKTEPKLFPQLLQHKIRLLVDSGRAGSLRAEDIKMLLETVDISSGALPHFVVQQVLIQESLAKVTQLFSLPSSKSEEERILKVVRNLNRHRTELPQSIDISSLRETVEGETKRAPDQKASDTGHEQERFPFMDRDPELGLIRRFVNSVDQRVFVITGIRGIGKSTMMRRVFAAVLPGWRSLWIHVADGTSFEQVVAQCASNFDLPVDAIPNREQARELAATLLTRMDLMDASALVLDDCHNLLEHDGKFADEDTKQFISDLVNKPSRKNAKVFLLSNKALPLPEGSLAAVSPRPLRGLRQPSQEIFSTTGYGYKDRRPAGNPLKSQASSFPSYKAIR